MSRHQTRYAMVARQLLQLLVWGGYGVLSLALFARMAGYSSGMVVISLGLTAGLWAASEWLRCLVVRHGWLQGSPVRLVACLLGLIAVLAAGVQVGIYLMLWASLGLGWASLPGGLSNYTPASALAYWFNTALVLGLWTAVWVGIAALSQSRLNEVARLRAETAQRGLELEALRARLNPHFVFNALNNVRALINEDTARARELVTRLSNTLRHALVHSQQSRVALSEEWAVMQDYLAVEAVQFEQRLQVDAWMDPALAEVEVPPMLLQLLVENAIKHGIARTPEGGCLCVRAEHVDGRVRLSVENPGRLESGGHAGTGIGLAWLHNQLERMQPRPAFKLLQRDEATVRAELEWAS